MAPAARGSADTLGSASSRSPQSNVRAAKTSITSTFVIVASMRSSVRVDRGLDVLALPAVVARPAPDEAHQHVARHLRLVERQVARRLPHLLVAALVLVAGLVARVRLEEATEVSERRALDGLDDERREIGHDDVANDRPEAFHDGNHRERPHDGFAHPLGKQELRLREGRVLRRDERRRDGEQFMPRGGELRLPCVNRRHAVEGSRRAVRPVDVEAAMAAHASRHEGSQVGSRAQELVARKRPACVDHGLYDVRGERIVSPPAATGPPGASRRPRRR